MTSFSGFNGKIRVAGRGNKPPEAAARIWMVTVGLSLFFFENEIVRCVVLFCVPSPDPCYPFILLDKNSCCFSDGLGPRANRA
jgi:hypothetical protein